MLVPIVAFSVIAVIMLYVMRLRHKQRMDVMNERDMTALYKDDLHAVAAGDSTLRVSFLFNYFRVLTPSFQNWSFGVLFML